MLKLQVRKTNVGSLGRIKSEEDRELCKIKPLCCIPIFNFLLGASHHLSLLS